MPHKTCFFLTLLIRYRTFSGSVYIINFSYIQTAHKLAKTPDLTLAITVDNILLSQGAPVLLLFQFDFINSWSFSSQCCSKAIRDDISVGDYMLALAPVYRK